MIKYIICKIKKHKFIDAGSCPFTGKSYNACVKCGKMIAK
jgi:hypothetical protein